MNRLLIMGQCVYNNHQMPGVIWLAHRQNRKDSRDGPRNLITLQNIDEIVAELSEPVCPCCYRQFNRKYDLKRHMQLHFMNRRFKCSFCQKCYSRKDNMNDHMLAKHGFKSKSNRKEPKDIKALKSTII